MLPQVLVKTLDGFLLVGLIHPEIFCEVSLEFLVKVISNC